MLKPFSERRPWAAVILSLLLGPEISMLYLGRGWLAALYGVLFCLVWGFQKAELIYSTQESVLYYIVTLIGTVNCYYFPSRKDFIFIPKWYSRWYVVPLVFLASIFLAFSCRAFVAEPFSVPAGSMNPTLHIGDTFFSKKFAYGYSRYSIAQLDLNFNGRVLSLGHLPRRGDIVTFKLPTNTSIDYVKRIIGLPGDTVQMINGRLYINGQIVYRKVVGQNQVEADDETVSVIDYLETLPGGVTHHIYEESDSRSLDNTREYRVPEGHYFMMGDNRDNSADSRVIARVGFVPIENITGKAYRIYLRDNKLVWLPLQN